MTITEAAEHRGVKTQAISDLIKRGRLQTITALGRTLILKKDIEKFTDNRLKQEATK